MKKIIIKNLSLILGAFILLGMAFSLSSKGDPLGDSTSISCKDKIAQNLNDAYIQINFEADGCKNPFRRTGYGCYVPPQDLRNGRLSAGNAAFESQNDYLCNVLITSPQCPDFKWSQYLTANNTTTGGKMEIKLPPVGYDITLKVTYTEVFEQPGGLDYNIQGSGSDRTAVVYTFEQTYFSGWDSKIPQPIFLKATSQKASICASGCNGYTKKLSVSDYKDLNDYLVKNKLFGN